MRALLMLIPLLAAAPAMAQQHKPATPPAKPEGPKAIGRFDDWTAATNTEAGQTVCYAFTRATHSAPPIPGRTEVVLTVTERPTGRDTVAITAGFAYAPGASVAVQADQTALEFYAAGRSAFARDGHTAAAALNHSLQVTARSPGPHNTSVLDTFSLKGFARAYDAIARACPPK